MAWLARLGPTTPPMIPPASTHEIARSFSAGATTSVAANRYSAAFALAYPATSVAATSSQKLCCMTASMQTSAATKATALPSMKARWRPKPR